MLATLQRIPATGDSFKHDGRRFTVVGMDGLRVESVKIEAQQPQLPSPTTAVS